ncbi:PREDICTED: Krueppel-like factor 6 [Rhagoletis zephyria]|uniref:Krueppel-like factor 6 n=1 Tax=Rhagoletis zephyria TaxID=28612 RepID=UPI0008114B28|nr:PREDICTED: Krueppel-like factor 6 [Rhagoletis zephyria]
MDFFATGGFQQLFSDLNDTQPQVQWVDFSGAMDGAQAYESYDYCADGPIECSNPLIQLTCTDDPFVLTTAANEQSLLELEAEWCELTVDSSNCGSTNDNNANLQYFDCSVINERELQLTLDQLLSSPPAFVSEVTCLGDAGATQSQSAIADGNCAEDKNNNSAYNTLSSPSSVDTSSIVELETAAFITREMAEWEEKFLDNYIEIPELIDFLPEKTPLCTETCEHFLHESSKNLKLHRKARSTKRASETTNCNEEHAAAGYPCTFGTCDKIYEKPAHLKAHLRRHMGEKPYTCDWPECTWKFSRSDELARHRRSHSGVKPYKCNYCMKCFARSDHLTKHRKVHERRLLAASKAGKAINGVLPHSVFTVRPGRKRKNQMC